MSAQEVVPLAISGLALGISFYGIFERRNTACADLRVRITELVDRLGELGVEEQEYRHAHKDMPYDETRSVVGEIESRRLVPLTRRSRCWSACDRPRDCRSVRQSA